MLTKSDKDDIKAIVGEAQTTTTKEIVKLKQEVKKGFRKVHKDQETIIRFFNREVLELKSRVGKIESIPPINHRIKKS